MKDQQTSITVSGSVADWIRALVNEFPGSNANRIGRALVRLGLRQAIGERAVLVMELRALDAPCAGPDPSQGDRHAAPSDADLAQPGKAGR